MLNEDEKNAIKYFYNLRGTIDESIMLFDEKLNIKCGKEMIRQITLLLNLITKQSNILNKIEEYARGMEDKELLLILKSNEIDELINVGKKD